MRRVVLESPFAGDIKANVEYARACMHDCLLHNEAPIASHLLYTQPGILDDTIPEERNLGIEAGLVWGKCGEKSVVYIDRGISNGMRFGIERAKKDDRLVEFRTLQHVKIMTVTGPSGAGKTTIIKKLFGLKPNLKLVLSSTTRDSRPSDLPGEYACSLPKDFFNDKKKFLWIVSAHGNIYGTRKNDVDNVLSGISRACMILIPEAVETLRKYADRKKKKNILSFYIMPPDESELRTRLKNRGAKEDEIEKRINECKSWGEYAKNSGIPYIYINNETTENPDDGAEKTAREILKYLGY